MSDYKESYLMAENYHGIYTWKNLADRIDAERWHIKPKDLFILQCGPTCAAHSEYYWEVVEDVERYAYLVDDDGVRLKLIQGGEGDIFAIDERMPSEELEELFKQGAVMNKEAFILALGDEYMFRCPACKNEDEFQIIQEETHAHGVYIDQRKDWQGEPYSAVEVSARDVRCLTCERKADWTEFIVRKDGVQTDTAEVYIEGLPETITL